MTFDSVIAQADAYRIPLADRSVHCAITSPPYWGLRKYSGEQGRIWGGDLECEHEWKQRIRKEKSGGQNEWSQSKYFYGEQASVVPEGNDATCVSCGAWYGSLGLEPTPEQHLKNIVEIGGEVWRVLRDDGVFWMNYSDAYGHGSAASPNGGEAGDLMLMPHRVALALQRDGWIVRQSAVWYKRNPMPESINGTRWIKHRIKVSRSKHAADHNIKGGTQKMLEDASVHQGIDGDWVAEYTDCPGCEKCIPNDGLVLKRSSWRHTRGHESIFMLVKRMKYWSNQEAVREAEANPGASARAIEYQLTKQRKMDKYSDDPNVATTREWTGEGNTYQSGRNPRSVIDISADSLDIFHHWMGEQTGVDLYELLDDFHHDATNPGSVLDIPTAPYKGAHFATFPPNLIAPLIRATCPRWACPVCGAGWSPVVDRTREFKTKGRFGNRRGTAKHGDVINRDDVPHETWTYYHETLGYRRTCEHEHTQEEAVPGTVFDPFLGSGTTVAVARQLLLRGIGIDISMPYLDEQAKVRTGTGQPTKALDDLPLFAGINQ